MGSEALRQEWIRQLAVAYPPFGVLMQDIRTVTPGPEAVLRWLREAPGTWLLGTGELMLAATHEINATPREPDQLHEQVCPSHAGLLVIGLLVNLEGGDEHLDDEDFIADCFPRLLWLVTLEMSSRAGAGSYTLSPPVFGRPEEEVGGPDEPGPAPPESVERLAKWMAEVRRAP